MQRIGRSMGIILRRHMYFVGPGIMSSVAFMGEHVIGVQHVPCVILTCSTLASTWSTQILVIGRQISPQAHSTATSCSSSFYCLLSWAFCSKSLQ